MTKSDLKTGMRVITKEGSEYLVLLDTADGEDYLANYNRKTYLLLGDFYEDLTAKYCKDCSIVKVYSFTDGGGLLDPKKYLNLIWEREPVVEEITADEAMKRLEEQSGKRIKIIR